MQTQGPGQVKVTFFTKTPDSKKDDKKTNTNSNKKTFMCGEYQICPLFDKSNSDTTYQVELFTNAIGQKVTIYENLNGKKLLSKDRMELNFSQENTFDFVVDLSDRDNSIFDNMKDGTRYQFWGLTNNNFNSFPSRLSLELHVNLGDSYDEVTATKSVITMNEGIVKSIKKDKKDFWCQKSSCQYHVRVIGYGYTNVNIAFEIALPVTTTEFVRGITLLDEIPEDSVIGYKFKHIVQENDHSKYNWKFDIKTVDGDIKF